MVSFKHFFQSAKADGTDATLVKPSNWNEEHIVLTASEGIVLGRDVGAGPGPVQELAMSAFLPVGVIMPFAVPNHDPYGWLRCLGQTLNRTDFPALFGAIGGTYGAPTPSTFNLPDLRGRVIFCADYGVGRLTGAAIGGGVGDVGGAETEQGYAEVVVSVSTSGRSYGGTSGAQYVEIGGTTSEAYPNMYGGIVGSGDVNHGPHSHTFSSGNWTQGQALSVYADGTYSGSGSGGGWTQPATNIPPAIVLNYIIKMW